VTGLMQKIDMPLQGVPYPVPTHPSSIHVKWAVRIYF